MNVRGRGRDQEQAAIDAKPDREPPFDPTSWGGAFSIMLGVTAVLWIVEFVNASDRYRLDRFGLRPRSFAGLEGVLTSPFLHASLSHLISNTGPFLVLGWVVMISGVRSWLTVTAAVVLLGGLATWLVAPAGLIVGASGLVLGWLGYLLARAIFARKILWIVAAVMVLVFFSGLFSSLLPTTGSGLSWQAHVCGFAAGVVTAYVLHPRRGARPKDAPKKADA